MSVEHLIVVWWRDGVTQTQASTAVTPPSPEQNRTEHNKAGTGIKVPVLRRPESHSKSSLLLPVKWFISV